MVSTIEKSINFQYDNLPLTWVAVAQLLSKNKILKY